MLVRKQHHVLSFSTSADSHDAVMSSVVEGKSCASCALTGAAIAEDTNHMSIGVETYSQRSTR
jgi:hypothetical protein